MNWAIYLYLLIFLLDKCLIDTKTDCSNLETNFSSLKKHWKDDKYSDALSNAANGMILRVNSPNEKRKTIFLTFDACGQGGLSDGYDSLLVDFLIEEDIPVSFFISKKWAKKNPSEFEYITKKGHNIDVFNHGNEHIPLSSKGDSIYGIRGTNGYIEVYNEVEIASNFFCEKLGYRPKLFRPGTAYADEISVRFVNYLGYKVVGYSVLGDAGATFNKERIEENILHSNNGDIILFHFNHPESEVFYGVKSAIQKIKEDNSAKFGRLLDFL